MTSPSTTKELSRLREAIVGVDREVPLLDGSKRPYVYLDNAASTPAFRAVQEKVNEFLQWYSSVHRGAGFKSLLATEAYEEAREIVARFVGADPEAYCVVFVKNATEALNKLANRLDLRPDDVVLTTLMEHHSNDLPWRARAQVVYAGLREDGSLDLEDLARKLEHYKGRVRVVTVTGASNVTGFTPPIYDIAEMAHQAGAYMVADCAQLAPHRAVRMGDPGSPRHLDFIAFSAHKMYAPFGMGVLIGPRDFFRNGPPDYRGGGTIEIVNLDEVHWAEPPERDEAGSPNVVGAVALAESIRVLSQVGMDALEAHERDLTRYALQRLRSLPQVRVYGSTDPEQLEGRLGVISFEVNGVPHGKVAAVLAFEGGIGVRNGCFCAHPYVLNLLRIDPREYQMYKERALRGDRSALPGLVRVSFGCYNTLEEVDRLVEMLERIARGNSAGRYEVDRPSGMYWPHGFDRASLEKYFAL
ncbi:MAG: aminotransferase class V-fold PLP-dependent enzyme [Anaerolineae bacterium]